MSGKQITLDADALDALIEAKIAARMGGGNANLGTDPSGARAPTTEQWEAGVAELKGHNVPSAPYKIVRCKSERTESTFGCRVVKSRKFPQGRIISLDDYQHPAGTDKHVTEGGLVPEGMQIRGADGRPTPEYKQWRWEAYWQRDLRDYVGQPLLDRYRLEPFDPSEKWITGPEPEIEDSPRAAAE